MPPTSKHPADPRPLVLVADDDPLVVELMRVALTQSSYRVITALDGEEAVRQAIEHRPDAMVLEMRLPRRSGLEVCEFVRHGPDDPHVPLVLLSGPADTDARLDGLARGADEVLGKPFSPRELVARLHRLLVRAADARTQRTRAEALERELGRAQAESRRAHAGLEREHERRRLLEGFAREIRGLLDPDDIAARGLTALQQRLATRFALHLAPAFPGEPLRVRHARGASLARFENVSLAPDSEAGLWLASHGRPVRLADRTRFRELDAAFAPFLAAGCTLIVPMRTARGLSGLLTTDDRSDGGGWDAPTLEGAESIAEQLTPALHAANGFRAQQAQALTWLADAESEVPAAAKARLEAESLAVSFLAHAHLPGREAALMLHAVSLGAGAWSGRTRHALAGLASEDRTTFIPELVSLIDDAASLDGTSSSPERLRATLGAAVIVRHRLSRQGGRSMQESWQSALAWVSAHLDPASAAALERAWAQHEVAAA